MSISNPCLSKLMSPRDNPLKMPDMTTSNTMIMYCIAAEMAEIHDSSVPQSCKTRLQKSASASVDKYKSPPVHHRSEQ